MIKPTFPKKNKPFYEEVEKEIEEFELSHQDKKEIEFQDD